MYTILGTRIRFNFGALLPENAVVPPKMAKFGLLF